MARGTIWWDFDGTLTTRPSMWAEAAFRVVRTIAPGHDRAEAYLLRAMGEGMPWQRPDHAHPELTTADEWWHCVYQRFAEVFGELGLSEAGTPQAFAAIRREILRPERYSVYGDAEAVLSRLAASGWRHVMVSNHVPELPTLVEGLGLSRYFAAIVTSGVVGYEKPHPRMFEVARTHTLPGKPVWMVGDNLECDCLSVAPLGVHAILVHRSADPPYERQAADLREALRFIEARDA